MKEGTKTELESKSDNYLSKRNRWIIMPLTIVGIAMVCIAMHYIYWYEQYYGTPVDRAGYTHTKLIEAHNRICINDEGLCRKIEKVNIEYQILQEHPLGITPLRAVTKPRDGGGYIIGISNSVIGNTALLNVMLYHEMLHAVSSRKKGASTTPYDWCIEHNRVKRLTIKYAELLDSKDSENSKTHGIYAKKKGNRLEKCT